MKMTQSLKDKAIKKFRKEFPYDTLVSAHQDWTYKELEKFISQLVDDIVRETANDCLKICDDTKYEDNGEVLAVRLGYWQAQGKITEQIAKKYKLWAKYQNLGKP